MAENQHNDIFSDSQCLFMDIMERYAGERSSAAERQAVEKHLVDCPICSDAMEGLAIAGFSSDVKDRIANLNERIAASTEKSSGGIWKREYYSYAAGFIGVLLLSGLLLNYLKTSDIKNQNVLSDKIELESPVVEEDVTATTADEKEPAREAEENTAKWSDTADTIAVAEGTLAAVINKDAKALNFSITTTEEAGPEKDAQRTRSEHRSDNNLQNQVPEAGNGNEVVADLYKSEPPAELTEDAVDDLDMMEEVYIEEKEVHHEMQAEYVLSGEEQLAKSKAPTGKATKKSRKNTEYDGVANSSSDKKKESAKTMAQADEYDDTNTLKNVVISGVADPEMESEFLADLEAPMDSAAIDEQSPRFQGGESGLQQYLSDNVVYPDSAEKLGIEGRVHVSFNVNTDSTISDAVVIKPIGGGCDEEAIRVVNKMPNWAPAKRSGKIVSSQYELSIDFQPQKGTDEK